MENPTFVERARRLHPGDVLVLYTDGITEGRRDGEFYGEDRMLAAMSRGTSPESIVEGLVADVLDFQGGVPRDDIAVLAAGVPGS
jgi:sigma-B regulation protein RsbU (phosphoserine phosphatase)